MKIRGFMHKGLKRLYEDDNAKGVPPDSADKLRKMLAFLDAMQEADEIADACRVEGSHAGRRPQRHMEFKCYAQSPLDVLDRRRAANL